MLSGYWSGLLHIPPLFHIGQVLSGYLIETQLDTSMLRITLPVCAS
jgi:hypothetical protein